MVIYEHNIRAFMQFIAPYVTDMHYVVNEDIQGLIYTHISADMTVEKDNNPKKGQIHNTAGNPGGAYGILSGIK